VSEQHSPGPWRIDWNHANDGVHPTLPHLHYAAIISKDESLHISGYVSKANFHLIAAAPELLAFVKQQAADCAECKGTGVVTKQYGGEGYGDRCAALADADDQSCSDCEEIRALILKAEGKS
jgi:hypothetical protein